MRLELEDKLANKYPDIFKELGEDATKSCMAFGIAVGDGWYNLLDDLCSKITGKGVVAAQVKEKFGGLRFYVYTASEEVHKLIEEAEEKSFRTCERCGKEGKRQTVNGWIFTLCEECYTKLKKEGEII